MEESENNQKSKTSARDLGRKIKEYIDKGVEASKKGFKSAGSVIGEFGDKSVTRIELSQLNSKLSKEYASFGEMAYTQIVAKKGKSLDLSSTEAKSLVDSINSLIKDIKKHEKAIKEAEKKDAEKKEAKKSENNEKKTKKNEKM